MRPPPVVDSILDAVGHTPTVQLQRVVPIQAARVFLKLESFSPTGAIQDRLASMLFSKCIAPRMSASKPLCVVPSTGNLAISLAWVCALKDVELHVVLPEHISLERRQLLQAYGAKLHLTKREGGMALAVERARELALATPGSVYLDAAFETEAAQVYERTVAAELVETIVADGGRIDAFVCGVGTGALLTGLGRHLKERFPKVRTVAVEPESAPVLSKSQSGLHRMSEMGSWAPPPLLDRSLIDEIVSVSDEEAWTMKSRLGAEEGLLVGISTGAQVAAAVKWAERRGPQGVVYSLALDSGERDFSLAELFS